MSIQLMSRPTRSGQECTIIVSLCRGILTEYVAHIAVHGLVKWTYRARNNIHLEILYSTRGSRLLDHDEQLLPWSVSYPLSGKITYHLFIVDTYGNV
jgi:hypothetical protein